MLLLLAVIVFSFNSCIGVSMDIEINRNGSARLVLEYRISNILNSLGRLDGNESMPVIPAGRLDWERTAQRIPGMTISSHSMRETSHDTLINAALDFSNISALSTFLSSSGAKTSIIHNDRTGSFDITIFNKSEAAYDEDLIALMETVFSGYNFSLKFIAPQNCTVTITNGQGRTIGAPAAAAVSSQGRNVSLSMNIMDLIGLRDGLGVIINW